jgi:hypothetical protein
LFHYLINPVLGVPCFNTCLVMPVVVGIDTSYAHSFLNVNTGVQSGPLIALNINE